MQTVSTIVASTFALLSVTASTSLAQSCAGPTSYCTTSPNSVGSGAAMSSTGSTNPAANEFHLIATGCPPNQPLLFYYGAASITNPFGNGTQCVGSGGVGLFRFPPMQTDGSGTADMQVNFGQPPAGSGPGQWQVGDTWYCQSWYRDPAGGGAFFNLSDGLEVDVCAGAGTYNGMVLVPTGAFLMGDHSGTGFPNELPLHTVNLDAFYMDQFEVTNRKYADFLNTAYGQGRITVSGSVVHQVGGAGQALCDTNGILSYSRITWDGSQFGWTPGKEGHPMVMVSWYGACAYANNRSREDGLTPCYDESNWSCDFNANGYRLPTESEWEYAARGGHHTPYEMYPWGNSINGWNANYTPSGDPYEGGAQPWTTPVGYYNGSQIPAGGDMANGYGLYDMNGSVLEWCWDWHGAYQSSPSINPTGPSSGVHRGLRGGSWAHPTFNLRSAVRDGDFPTTRWLTMGFRVVAVRP